MKMIQPKPAATKARSLSFQPIRSARAFEEIAHQIRTELSEGRLKIGDRLPSERALSEQFGVSRNTLREALRSLEHAGLVRLQKGASGGAFISEGSDRAIAAGLMDMYHLGAIQPAQLTEARIWLESIIVREACNRATDVDIAELNANIQAAIAAAKEDDLAKCAMKHIEFHGILARITGNPVIMTVMNSVLEVLSHFVNKIGFYDNTFVVPSRRRFMKHLVEGDANAAVAEMETSLKRLQRTYLSLIDTPKTERPARSNGAVARSKPAGGRSR